eukprot:2063389-Pyramimonas_sp.AAC.1
MPKRPRSEARGRRGAIWGPLLDRPPRRGETANARNIKERVSDRRRAVTHSSKQGSSIAAAGPTAVASL